MNENEILYNQISELLEQENLEKAEESLLELRRKEESSEKNFLISKLLIEFGIKTSEQRYFNEARGKLKKLTEHDLNEVHFFLGNAYLKKYESLKKNLII